MTAPTPTPRWKILDIVKPDLRGVRNQIATELRAIRRRDPEEARRRLKRFQYGIARLEHDLNCNLLHGTSGMGSLSGLLEGNNG